MKLLHSKKWTLINDVESPPAPRVGIQLTTVSCSSCLSSWFSYFSIYTLVHPSSWMSAWVTSSRKPSQTNQVHTLDLHSSGSHFQIFHSVPLKDFFQFTDTLFLFKIICCRPPVRGFVLSVLWRVCIYTPHLCGHICVREHALVHLEARSWYLASSRSLSTCFTETGSITEARTWWLC